MKEEKVSSRALLVQFAATLCISLMAFEAGVLFSWPSTTVIFLMSNETVLDRPMTILDVSLLGGATNVGGLISAPFCGYVFSAIGRKYGCMSYGVPFLLTWLIIYLAPNIPTVLIAMMLAGVGIGGQSIAVIFISEISHSSIRGALTSFLTTGACIGGLFAYILAGQLSYYPTLYVNGSIAVICILSVMILKETPVHLLMKGKEKEAAESIAFYNQVEVSSKLVEIEMMKIKMQLDPRLEKLMEEEKDVELTEELIKAKLGDIVETRKESAWRIFRRSKSTKRALAVVLILTAAVAFMGNTAVQMYAEPLFKEVIPSMSANLCAIILASVFTVASVVCVLIVDQCGRKHLLMATSIVSGVCTLLLGIQLQFHCAPHWVTAVLIYVYSFMFAVGGNVPFVLMAEVFLPEVRSFCTSITIAFFWVVNFVTVVTFNPLVVLLGLGPVFYGFSAVCFSTAVYTKFKVPETKGLTSDVIQLKFLKT